MKLLSVLTRSQTCSSERRQTHRVYDQMITHEDELWSQLSEEPIREDSAELSHTLRGHMTRLPQVQKYKYSSVK